MAVWLPDCTMPIAPGFWKTCGMTGGGAGGASVGEALAEGIALATSSMAAAVVPSPVWSDEMAPETFDLAPWLVAMTLTLMLHPPAGPRLMADEAKTVEPAAKPV